MLGFVGKVVRRTREQGLRSTLRWTRFRLNEEFHEWRLGVHTKGYVDRADLGQDDTSAHYEPTPYPLVRRALAHMTIRPGEDVLVDYGSGKGRIVAAAAQHPFRRIVGIELSEALSATAQDNIPRIKGRKCDDVEVVGGNAMTFDPPDDMSIAFLFNPFYPPVIDAVRDRIKSSLDAHPRALTIYYLLPTGDRNYVGEWDFVAPAGEVPTRDAQKSRLFVYRHDPPR